MAMSISKMWGEEVIKIAELTRLDVVEGANKNSWEQHARPIQPIGNYYD